MEYTRPMIVSAENNIIVPRRLAVLFLSSCCLMLIGNQAFGQAGLRESLERLDTNKNGRIDPDEVTATARPYLERIASSKRLALDKSNDISEFQEAARIYHALQNGVAGREIEVESKSSLLPFGPDAKQPLIPEFGLTKVLYPYIQEDLDEADRTLRRYDRNRDKQIDREEAADARWTHNDPFDMDLNNDNRLSRLELAQRFARRRLVSNDAGELIRKAMRTGTGVTSSKGSNDSSDEDGRWWRRGGSNNWLTGSVLSRFDLNRNGQLEQSEAKSLGISFGLIDIDRDGLLSRSELDTYFKEVQAEAGDASSGLPGWFFELDADRDGQVSMAEFTQDWTEDKLNEFSRLDANDDGLLTSDEVAKSKANMGGDYRNEVAEVLPPGKTIISEIEIDDDVYIRDLNIQLSITHTSVGMLDGFLTGPSGQRIELFSEIGGSDDHFNDTIFDDQADTPINKARAPFEGRYLPLGLLKRQPSLSSFNDQSAKGIWQLVIRGTRSDRFGMLHHWSLSIQPKEKMLDEPAATAAEIAQ